MAEPLIEAERVSHFYGSGELRKQILHEVSTGIAAGEIVILTGPSGSGKTTLLTLVGALRATQQGSLRVFDQELCGAPERTLVAVRRRIGFIFQLHNLLDALSVTENVMMGLPDDAMSRSAARRRALEMLAKVALEDKAGHHPDQLSGGQKQRVAIARALSSRPRIILADEPTASLDKQSGREVVNQIQELAKSDGTAAVLVTHDNRILDIADRIVHLEEGRLSSFADAVRASTQQLLGTLAKSDRGEELSRDVMQMDAEGFVQFLTQVSSESQQVLGAMSLATDGAFERMLERVLRTITFKVGQLLEADRTSLLLGDEAAGELWSLVTQEEGDEPLEIRMPASAGIAGHVYRTGEIVNVENAYESPHFNPEVDRRTSYRTRSVLCAPIRARSGRPFAVMTLLNKHGGAPFDARDEQRLCAFTASVAVVLETWHESSRAVRSRGGEGGAAGARAAAQVAAP